MTYSYYITPKQIKDNTPILGYVNEDELVTFIRPAQDMYIERVVGTRLNTRLQTRIQMNTVNADDIELLKGYIQPALQYWVLHEFLLLSHYKLTNKSVTKQDSDNSQAADLTEVRAVKSNIRDWAEYYSQRMTDYLMDHTNEFPEYMLATGYQQKVGKRNNYIFGGMFIPPSKLIDCPEATPWQYVTLNV